MVLEGYIFGSSNLVEKASCTELSLDDLLPTQLLIPATPRLSIPEDLDIWQLLERGLADQSLCQLLRLRVAPFFKVFEDPVDSGEGLNSGISKVVASQLADSLQKLWHDEPVST